MMKDCSTCATDCDWTDGYNCSLYSPAEPNGKTNNCPQCEELQAQYNACHAELVQIMRILHCIAEAPAPSMEQTVVVRGVCELADRVRKAEKCPVCGKRDALASAIPCQFSDAINATQQQTAEQIERWHREWMMSHNKYGFVPSFVKFRRDKCGCLYAEYELQLTDCGGEFEGQAPTLFAIPPLPKE